PPHSPPSPVFPIPPGPVSVTSLDLASAPWMAAASCDRPKNLEVSAGSLPPCVIKVVSTLPPCPDISTPTGLTPEGYEKPASREQGHGGIPGGLPCCLLVVADWFAIAPFLARFTQWIHAPNHALCPCLTFPRQVRPSRPLVHH